jgi:hypothetical protein
MEAAIGTRSSRRANPVPDSGPAVRRILRVIALRRDVLFIVGVILAAAFAARAVWLHVRDDVFRGAAYRLTLDDIQITPLPSWIKSDVKAEALRDGSLDQPLLLLDDDLSERIAKAFALHPWVATVKRVSKRYPAGANVELTYRRPVAMVEVTNGLFPVDANGVLLPSPDFTTDEARGYPRIAQLTSQPLGPVGTEWSDPLVTGAASIAAQLGPLWNQLGLYQIRSARPTPSSASGRAQFELVTRSGAKIVWGGSPHEAATGEPTAAEKISVLKKLQADFGSLDEAARNHNLDLRKQPASDPAIRAVSVK